MKRSLAGFLGAVVGYCGANAFFEAIAGHAIGVIMPTILVVLAIVIWVHLFTQPNKFNA